MIRLLTIRRMNINWVAAHGNCIFKHRVIQKIVSGQLVHAVNFSALADADVGTGRHNMTLGKTWDVLL